ncbi:MAG: hypothetical protein WBG28_11650 [Desulfobulbales bacterium]
MSVPIDVSTLSGAVNAFGMSVVIFIFGDAAHAAVVRQATIKLLTAMVAKNLIFIVYLLFFFREWSVAHRLEDV